MKKPSGRFFYLKVIFHFVQLVAGLVESGALKHPLRLRIERVDLRVQFGDVLFPRELLNFADDAPADVLVLEALRHDDVDLAVRMQADVAAQAAAVLDVKRLPRALR